MNEARGKKPIYMSELQRRQKEMRKVRPTRVRVRGGSYPTTDSGQFYMDVNRVLLWGGNRKKTTKLTQRGF